MTINRIIFAILILALLAVGIAWLGPRPAVPIASAGTPPSRPSTLRLGLIPERDIFQERHAYRALADYLEPKLGCKVELVTNNTYEGILKDFENRQVDAAFLGSLVAAMAADRFGSSIILKSETQDQLSTYAGVIFVPENSPIHSFSDLRGKSLGAVHTTTAGAVFPLYLMQKANMPEADRPKLVWTGTHDDVIREVVAGHLDAGAVKDLRLDAYQKEHPDARFRRLAVSDRVPNNALVLRADLPPAISEQLRLALLLVSDDKKGGGPQVLQELGVHRYLPASLDEYAGLYDMLDIIGPQWPLVGIDGPAPHRPRMTQPSTHSSNSN